MVTDPRQRQGVRHKFGDLVIGILAAMLAGKLTVRELERLSERLGLGRDGDGISDSTVSTVVRLLNDDAFKPVLVESIKSMGRRGQLKLVGLRQHWVAIDGKYKTLDHDASGKAQRFQDKDKKSVYWRLGFLRAVLVSAVGSPALGQHVMLPKEKSPKDPDKAKHTGEISNLWSFVTWLRKAYGELTTNFSVDAGLWSRELFARFDEAGLGLFGSIKENKPELHQEAARILRIAQRQEADAESAFEPSSRGMVRRRLWRSTKLDGWNGWKHLRQVVLVEQTTRPRDGGADIVELRYFGTNVGTGHLSPSEMLLLVRRHWAIENDCNWTFDVIMGEDDHTFCTTKNAVLALGILRMIAYNMLQWLRCSHAKQLHPRAAPTPMSWRALHEHIFALWVRLGVTFPRVLAPPKRA